MNRTNTGRNRGFTLIEMMVVISIILILTTMVMPIYSRSIQRKREQNLRQNLEALNKAIFQYAQDRQKSPQSLDDLKAAGYLKKIPDDITGTPDWATEESDGVIMSLDQKDADGIIGVHSSSNQIGSDGTAYSTW
jgi:general secretion pathway protein G